jgi:excisionase family DNA binding protein
VPTKAQLAEQIAAAVAELNAPVGHRFATIGYGAKYIDAHPATVRKWIAEGKLKGYNGGGWRMLRIDLNELDRLMEGGK